MDGHPSRGEHAGHSATRDAAPHLLLVEDDATLSQALVQTLTTHLPAVTVTAVSAVEQAWRTVQEGDVRLLITDLNLPGIRGWSFIQHLRERGWHRPVIVMSAAPAQAGHEVCEMLKITAVLTKPFEMTSFLQAVAAALNRDTQECVEERT
jgi:chemosensory pili system protein ChpA (sensor histidine kinase/response regulator)